jgi:hypothetical protein
MLELMFPYVVDELQKIDCGVDKIVTVAILQRVLKERYKAHVRGISDDGLELEFPGKGVTLHLGLTGRDRNTIEVGGELLLDYDNRKGWMIEYAVEMPPGGDPADYPKDRSEFQLEKVKDGLLFLSVLMHHDKTGILTPGWATAENVPHGWLLEEITSRLFGLVKL